jgi:peptidoglycan/LPS O-acetylase OafA/YrhL
MENSTNLDLLRTTAVLLVVGDHSLKIAFGVSAIAGVDINMIGLLGVLLFFVHTCLVLMYSLERQEKRQGDGGALQVYGYFYIRRALRIYPLSIFALACIVAFHIPSSEIVGIGVLASHHPSFHEFVVNALLMQNLFFGNHILGPLWSLPWEVQMYLLLPLIYRVLGRSSRWKELLVIWGLALLLADHIHLVRYLPNFLPGVIAYAIARKVRPFLPSYLWPLFLGGLIVAYGCAPGVRWGRVICLVLGCGVPFFRQLSFRPLAFVANWIATYSYGIYLGHLFCLWVCFSVLPHVSVLPRIFLFVVLLVAVPFLLYHCIEKPLISYGVRIGDAFVGLRSPRTIAIPDSSRS